MRLLVTIAALLLAQAVNSHHSSIGIYDEENLVEIEGVVTSVRWRNSHPSYTIAVTDANGQTVEWQIETGSVSTLRLRGVDREFIQVGDRVRLAGQSSLRGLPEMFAQNMLLDNGEEVLLRAVSRPCWSAGLNGTLYERGVDEERADEGRRSANGIFRVWSPRFDDPDAYPLYSAGVGPLTAAAQALKAQWDPRNSPYMACQPKAMPYIMGTAYPLEFIQKGDDLLIRIEEFDTERVVDMDAERSSVPDDYSRLGHSRGHWDGETLIVETDRVETSVLYTDGTPQSRAIHLLEQFEMNEDQDRLDYRLTISDPETFSEPLEFSRYWVWPPDIRLQPYNCGNQL